MTDRIEDGGAAEAGRDLVERLRDSLPAEYATFLADNRAWSGSAFVAGEKVEDEQQSKYGLYRHLCLVSSYLVAAEELANDTIEAAAEITRLRAENAGMRGALKPFAAVAEQDIGADETDGDLFRPMAHHNRAPQIVVGDLRRARSALSNATTPTPAGDAANG